MKFVSLILAGLLVAGGLTGCKSDADMDDQIISKERQAKPSDDADENDQD